MTTIVIDNQGHGVDAVYAVLSDKISELERLAALQNLVVRWAFVMCSDALWVLAKHWPANPATRRWMYQKQYLFISNKKFEVILDDSGSGTGDEPREDDIYIVPLDVNGDPVRLEMPEKQVAQ